MVTAITEHPIGLITNFTIPALSEWEQMKIDFKIKPLSDSGYIGSAIYLTCLGIISTIGNSLIIAMFLKEKKLRMKPHNLLLLNLAVSDLGISIFGYPWTTASCYAGRYLFGRVGCTIQGFTTFTLAQTDMNTLACLSFYRYINICKPHYNYKLTPVTTKWLISLIWVYSIVWTAPPLFGWSSYIPEPFGTSCSIDWTNGELAPALYTWLLVIFCYLIHIVTIVFCYYQISVRAREVQKSLSNSVSHPLGTDEVRCFHRIAMEKKVTLISLAMTGLFILIWAPYTIVCLWSIYDKDIPIWITTFPTMFAKSSCLLNPLLYFLTNSAFRQCIWRMLNCKSPINIINFRSRVETSYCVNRARGDIYIGSTTIRIEHVESAIF